MGFLWRIFEWLIFNIELLFSFRTILPISKSGSFANNLYLIVARALAKTLIRKTPLIIQIETAVILSQKNLELRAKSRILIIFTLKKSIKESVKTIIIMLIKIIIEYDCYDFPALSIVSVKIVCDFLLNILESFSLFLNLLLNCVIMNFLFNSLYIIQQLY